MSAAAQYIRVFSTYGPKWQKTQPISITQGFFSKAQLCSSQTQVFAKFYLGTIHLVRYLGRLKQIKEGHASRSDAHAPRKNSSNFD